MQSIGIGLAEPVSSAGLSLTREGNRRVCRSRNRRGCHPAYSTGLLTRRQTMLAFGSSRWLRFFQVLRMALLVPVMLGPFHLRVQAQGKERPMGAPNLLSQHSDRRALDLLQRGGPEGCADAAPSPRPSVFPRVCSSLCSPGFPITITL
jgi:hypothetical protein